jgi:acetamidase/formamidase
MLRISLLSFLGAVLLVHSLRAQGKLHELKCAPGNVQAGHYDSDGKPVLRIASGDIVRVETCSGAPDDPNISPSEVPKAWAAVEKSITDRGPGVHLLTGPIHVDGAEPGDVLEVRFQRFEYVVPFGVMAIAPNFTGLPDDFPYELFRVLRINTQAQTADFLPNITLKLAPFFGSVGVAPPSFVGRVSSNPPGLHGGNLDNRELTEGSTLYLPVHIRGALLSVGDAHAVQGDGEVSCCALETALIGTMQLTVRKGRRLLWPRAETPTHYVTMGFNADLDQAAQVATREMVEFLVAEKKLSRDDAFMLCSVAMDLRITQVVDGTKGIHAMLAKSIFRR